MKRYKGRYRIESTRLPDYDYAAPGWYHIVLCTADRVCFFGEIRNGRMGLSALGATAHCFCEEIPDHVCRAVLDAFVVMPNHVHAIVGLLPVETLHATSLQRRNARGRTEKEPSMSERSPGAGSLGTIVRSYKSAVTRWARRNDYPTFAWQSRFWDRVIRNERELDATRRYIADNPLKWHLDRLHPDCPL